MSGLHHSCGIAIIGSTNTACNTETKITIPKAMTTFTNGLICFLIKLHKQIGVIGLLHWYCSNLELVEGFDL
jgi:hypothetical protein